jgi:hypothetical protein
MLFIFIGFSTHQSGARSYTLAQLTDNGLATSTGKDGEP